MVILRDSLPRIAQIKIVVMFLVIDRMYNNIFSIIHILWKVLRGTRD